MTVEELLVLGKSKVHSDYAKILLGDLLNLNPLELLVHLDDIVDQEKIDIYKKELDAMVMEKPLQYVLGYTNFYGNKFIVNENVLIPRFETEELVENTIKYIKEYLSEDIDIIDLGCGSGAIGLTLKEKLPRTNITLVDISNEALSVAKKNADNLGLLVNFKQNNMLNNIDKKYDVVISNPPYIREDEEIEEIVKKNEPHIALYAKENGLEFYNQILSTVKKNLKEKFIIAFEIGMEQKEAVTLLANKYLNDITVIAKKDMQDRDRMIFIISNNLISTN